MSFPIIGLGFVIGAVALSRRPRVGLGGLGATSPGPNTSEALDATERAAQGLYEPVDHPRSGAQDVFWEDPAYTPACDLFNRESLEALHAAQLAEDAGEPDAYSAKIAAVQAWALSQVECERETPEWATEQAERPVTR